MGFEGEPDRCSVQGNKEIVSWMIEIMRVKHCWWVKPSEHRVLMVDMTDDLEHFQWNSRRKKAWSEIGRKETEGSK